MSQFVFILPKASLLFVSPLFVPLNVICMDLTTAPQASSLAYADRPTKRKLALVSFDFLLHNNLFVADI